MVVANATKRLDAGRSILPEKPHVRKLSKRRSEVTGLELMNNDLLKRITNNSATLRQVITLKPIMHGAYHSLLYCKQPLMTTPRTPIVKQLKKRELSIKY